MTRLREDFPKGITNLGTFEGSLEEGRFAPRSREKGPLISPTYCCSKNRDAIFWSEKFAKKRFLRRTDDTRFSSMGESSLGTRVFFLVGGIV